MQDCDEASLRAAYEAVTGPLAETSGVEPLLDSLRRALATARTAHPGFPVAAHRFIGRLAEIAGKGVEARQIIDETHVADLWLVLAAVGGDAEALRAVDELLESAVKPLLMQRLGRDAARLDEVMQRVRVRMLVGDQDHRAKLLSFNANGRFAAWARVVAVRAAYTLLGELAAHPTVEIEDSLVQAALLGNDDPELQVLLARYAPLLRRAMEAAIGMLANKERTLLRMSLVDGVSIDQIGAIYNCHRATAARWLAAAKESLSTHARREFCGLAQASEAEFYSVIRAMPGYFDVSMERLLAQSHAQTSAV